MCDARTKNPIVFSEIAQRRKVKHMKNPFRNESGGIMLLKKRMILETHLILQLFGIFRP